MNTWYIHAIVTNSNWLITAAMHIVAITYNDTLFFTGVEG